MSAAARDTPYEVEVNQCMVERMESVNRDGIPDKYDLYYKDDMPTTLVMEEDEVALETICRESRAWLSERKAEIKRESSQINGEIGVNNVNVGEFSSHTKPRKKKKPQLSEEGNGATLKNIGSDHSRI